MRLRLYPLLCLSQLSGLISQLSELLYLAPLRYFARFETHPLEQSLWSELELHPGVGAQGYIDDECLVGYYEM